MTVMDAVAVSVDPSAAVAVIVCVVAVCVALGVPVMRQVLELTPSVKPVGRAGETAQLTTAEPVLVKLKAVIVTVVA